MGTAVQSPVREPSIRLLSRNTRYVYLYKIGLVCDKRPSVKSFAEDAYNRPVFHGFH